MVEESKTQARAKPTSPLAVGRLEQQRKVAMVWAAAMAALTSIVF
jgi:hypothetical protein